MSRKRGSSRKSGSWEGRMGRLGEGLSASYRFYGRVPPAAAAAAAVILFISLALIVVNKIMSEARYLPRFTVDPSRLHCSGKPDWLDMTSDPAADVLGEIKSALTRFNATTIFDDRFIKLLQRDICRECPWVEEVAGVERVFPAQVKIRLRLRRPAAVFFRRSRGFYVDSRGVVIDTFPAAERDRIADRDLPEIRGAPLSASPRRGKPVTDAALREGAAVAADVQDLRRCLGDRMIRVRTIDVSRYGRGRPEDAVLVTEGGTRLNWGRSSRHAAYQGIDPTVEQKAQNLESVLDKRPNLSGVAEVTLAFEKPTYRLEADALTDE
jgi:hypothetical protein